MSISIAVVEADEELRSSIVKLIKATDDFRLVAEYANAEDAQGLHELNVDVVILDIVLPGMSGLELMKKIRVRNSAIQFLVCSCCIDDDKIFSSLACGASGYLVKNLSSTELINAVRELHNGGGPMSPFIARRVINSFQKKNDDPCGLLTDREKQILELASEGLMYKEIAVRLKITHETVKRHLKNIYHKLHVQNKIEAINKYNG